MMVEIIRRLIIGGITLGVIAGNSDNILQFYDETVAMSRQIATAGDMRTISLMLDYHYLKKGRLPTGRNFDKWLENNFKENTLKTVMTDHWGNPMTYTISKNKKQYVLISSGPDGIFDNDDDLKRSGP